MTLVSADSDEITRVAATPGRQEVGRPCQAHRFINRFNKHYFGSYPQRPSARSRQGGQTGRDLLLVSTRQVSGCTQRGTCTATPPPATYVGGTHVGRAHSQRHPRSTKDAIRNAVASSVTTVIIAHSVWPSSRVRRTVQSRFGLVPVVNKTLGW